MADFSALLALEPKQQLEFSGGSGGEEQTLRLRNVSSNPVAWKVKTTAPKAYLVRPSSALLKPGDTTAVQICLQPTDSHPVDFSNHRFLVQATAAAADRTSNLAKADWEALAKTDIKEARLTVVERAKGGKGGEVQKNYDELVGYVVQLETENIELQKKLKSARSGYKLWHLILAVLLAIGIMKFVTMPQAGAAASGWGR
ncbi:unnamed protein product [Amoebophrya sp. A25]|nr:unnamed protein product [Amoebophrya sp. A25]|eukprot:GSA25T00019613001.1